MPEKEPLFTVTDRRKFTLDGALRPGVTESEAPPPAAPPQGTPPAEAPHPADAPATALPAGQADSAQADFAQDDPAQDTFEDELPPPPSAHETHQQNEAYRESSRTLDEMVARQNPRARAAGEMTFDRLVQSVYMTAALQLGAGAQPGEQPRVDIMGARQSIDMLSVLADKTKGNLTPNEERLLQNAVFELRMTFLEITNAIASSAHTPPSGPGGKAPGGIKGPGLR